MASEAIAQARQLGAPDVLLEVLDVAGSAYVEYAPIELRLQTAEALLERALSARDFVRIQRARARLAFERAALGNFEAFELHVAEMLSEANSAGRAQAKIRPLLMASLGACCRGKIAESDQLLAEARQLLLLTEDPGLALSFRAHILSRALQLHLDAELEALEPTLATLVQGLPNAELTLAVLRGVLHARLEQLEPARHDLRVAWSRVSPVAGVFVILLAEIAAFVREPEICAACHTLLLPLAGTDALGGHVSVSYEGPIDRLLGLLEGVLGQHDTAEQKLRAALALAERRGFEAWVAQGHFDLGNWLSSTGAARLPEAHAAWKMAAARAEACGMVGLAARAEARIGGAAARAAPASVRHAPVALAKIAMVRQGELYLIEHGPHAARIRASRGAELLARLIDAPNQEIHVLALAADDSASLTESNAGDTVDRTALRQYRARLAELEGLMTEAERRDDVGHAEALRGERAALERELSRALGLGGRARQAGSTTERARVNVQRRLKDTIDRITEASPELGAWLGRSLRTGTYCSFNPKL